MADEDSPFPQEDQPLEEAIAAYLEAVASGEPPDRAQFLATHPGLARELAEFFADHDAVQRLAQPFKAQGAAESVQGPRSGESRAGSRLDISALPPGTRVAYFGDYELLEEIGCGGMGIVYKARQRSLNRVVALKMVRGGHLASEEDVQRFRCEAEAAANLQHPGIVAIHEVGQHVGQHYFSMDYIEGQSLAARLADGPLPPSEAAELIAVVAVAVHYAHQKGVVHRDLKPGNVLLDQEGRPHVTDFGLAKRVAGGRDLTTTGQILGTPSYMPPEQAAAQLDRIGPASDIYALGAVLYACLIGRPPFQAASPVDTLRQVLDDEPARPRQLNAGIPRDLETIALKCLQKERNRRYATAQHVADDLRRYLKGEPIQARPVGRPERLWRWCKRNRASAALAATAGALALLAAIVIAVAYVRTSRALADVVKAQHERVAAQIDALRRAEISQVPYLTEDLEPFRDQVLPQVREILDQPDLTEKERLRLSLAVIQEDEGQLDYLRDRLLAAQPDEFLVIRAALLPYRERLTSEFWRIAEDASDDQARAFRAACSLAAFDPSSARWQIAGRRVADTLVGENPLAVSIWLEALRPVRGSIRPGLTAAFRDAQRAPSERALAVSMLAEYASDQPLALADLLADADPKQFAVLFPRLHAHGNRAVASLRVTFKQCLPDNASNTRDRFASRQANLAVALLRMDQPEEFWQVLRHSPDPSARSHAIHRLLPLRADPRALVQRLAREADVSIRRALLLSLGEFPVDRLSEAERSTLVPQLVDMYRDDPDSGIHGAAEWLLRQWKHHAQLPPIERALATGKAEGRRQWYINGQGQTMVMIQGPLEFMMGSPEDEKDRIDIGEPLHRQRIGRAFAIAAKEVTVEQFARFAPGHKHSWMSACPEPACPVMVVNWYAAAAYCNWLNRQEGVPQSEWCYLPNDAGAYAEGMRVAPGWHKRIGYRLPTEAEWECACRAGALTSRFYGQTDELLCKYACYEGNTKSQRTWPVGSLKPNDLGLFDMLGSQVDWCHNQHPAALDGPDEEDPDGEVVKDNLWRIGRGGGFSDPAKVLRCALRFTSVPWARNSLEGFRVARTCRRTSADLPTGKPVNP